LLPTGKQAKTIKVEIARKLVHCEAIGFHIRRLFLGNNLKYLLSQLVAKFTKPFIRQNTDAKIFLG
jgi:hypothetical protein